MLSKAIAIILLSWVLSSCATQPERSTAILQRDGYTEIEITGYPFPSGCSSDDIYQTGFRAIKNGQYVEGVVCAGLTKGATIRITN